MDMDRNEYSRSMAVSVAVALMLLSVSADSTGLSCSSGALAAGGDLLVANLTVDSALSWCNNQPACGGFTARSPQHNGSAVCAAGAHSTMLTDVHFKSLLTGNSDSSWLTWKKDSWTAPFFHCAAGRCEPCDPLHQRCERVTYTNPACFDLCSNTTTGSAAPPYTTTPPVAPPYTTTPPVAPPYTVDHSLLRGRNAIVDVDGREVVFRGMNVGVEIWKNDKRPSDPAAYSNGKCPSAAGSVNQPPVCSVSSANGKWNQSTSFDSQNDLAQMRALGFNLIRLAISWSLLEPSPLQYSERYLDRIEQVVSWAAEQNIDVIIDMHQDEYSSSLGEDGAPEWACLNVSLPAWVELIWSRVASKIPFAKEVLLAFDAFYTNQEVASTGKGLQDHFIMAWGRVVNRFDSVHNVIGYEVINEPPPGILTTVDSVGDIPILGFTTRYLFPLYRRFIQAITGVRDGMKDCPTAQPIGDNCAYPDLQIKSRKLIFFEPMALRNELDFSLQVSKPFTEYSNIVFCPHIYTNFFTAKNWPPSYRLALDSAWFEANLLKAGVLVTEFGGSTSGDNGERVGNITAGLDIHRGTSGTMWTWKERGNWAMFEDSSNRSQPNGPVKQIRVQINSRIYARAVVGGILKHIFDHQTGSFHLIAFTDGKGTKPTEVYIPAHLNISKPAVSGAAELVSVDAQPDGSLVVVVKPRLGLYHVTIGASIPDVKTSVSDYEYKGISVSAMSKVALAIWPLHNLSSQSLLESGVEDLQMALGDVANEISNAQSVQ